jgi:hypothetical protein
MKKYSRRGNNTHKDEPEQKHSPETSDKGLQQYGCLPGKTLDEIRREIMETHPGTTILELEAMGC